MSQAHMFSDLFACRPMDATSPPPQDVEAPASRALRRFLLPQRGGRRLGLVLASYNLLFLSLTALVRGPFLSGRVPCLVCVCLYTFPSLPSDY
jgi:hypothetical protein